MSVIHNEKLEKADNSSKCCFICGDSTQFCGKICDEKANYSNRQMSEIIEHISKVKIKSSHVACQMCMIKLNNYDEYSTRAEHLQSELIILLEHKNQNNEIVDDYPVIDEKICKSENVKISTHTCDYLNCGRIFKTPYRLQFHKAFHTTERKFQCKICEKFYKTKVCLKSHMKLHQKANNRVICDVCGESFTAKQSLLRHYGTAHLKLRLFICQICAADFSSRHILQLHLLTHGENNRKYVCEICSSRFYSKSKLNRHMRGHGEKQFKCNICHRKYTQRYNLNAHIRASHGDTNVQKYEIPQKFVCQMCGNFFLQNAELKSHLRKAHENKSLEM